jgi:hypothetical protein
VSGATAIRRKCCCGGGGPACPGCLRIVGYEDGDLAACEECDGATATRVWPGTFPIQASCELWQAVGAAYYAKFGAMDLAAATQIAWDAGASVWRMTIVCEDDVVVWEGTKAGTSPVGTYARTSGCDETTSIAIEQYGCPCGVPFDDTQCLADQPDIVVSGLPNAHLFNDPGEVLLSEGNGTYEFVEPWRWERTAAGIVFAFVVVPGDGSYWWECDGSIIYYCDSWGAWNNLGYDEANDRITGSAGLAPLEEEYPPDEIAPGYPVVPVVTVQT